MKAMTLIQTERGILAFAFEVDSAEVKADRIVAFGALDDSLYARRDGVLAIVEDYFKSLDPKGKAANLAAAA